MNRVTGIGGVFFSAKDPITLRAWKKHLGIDVQPWGGAAFSWTDAAGKPTNATIAWSIDSGWVMDPEGNKVELWEPPPGQ